MTHALPTELKYTNTHEWTRVEKDGTVTIGITDHAQQLLGDLVFVELPSIGKDVSAGSEVAVVESVKAASDVYSPIAGQVIAVNEALNQKPEFVNQSPYQNGWLFKLKPLAINECDGLLSASDYENKIG